MSDQPELPSDSDDSDEDYIPDGAENEAVSEVDSDGDAESSPENENDENVRQSSKHGTKGKKRGKREIGERKKMRKTVASSEEIEENGDEKTEEKELTEEEEKKRADSLWADFMKDTNVLARPKSTSLVNSSTKSPPSSEMKSKPKETVKITKLFEFAGEEVRVEKEVPADCAEARLLLPGSKDAPRSVPASTVSKGTPRTQNSRKAGLGGISSVLGQLGKKAKISTLEKSKLDWDSYKKEENIEEEIETHNKGKDGYLERQDFLQRADLRQFELEKEMRSSRRTRR